ncbi:unnamed protein product [marine sediment metagenome]|uniref:Uncharacterized protein n=1 Tax=marine sediment metagenome TaxID=412755 RepID=X1C4D5_9ZZZZ
MSVDEERLIVLERVYEGGRYLGMIAVDRRDLTTELLRKIRVDKDWKKYHGTLKSEGYEVEEMREVE